MKRLSKLTLVALAGVLTVGHANGMHRLGSWFSNRMASRMAGHMSSNTVARFASQEAAKKSTTFSFWKYIPFKKTLGFGVGGYGYWQVRNSDTPLAVFCKETLEPKVLSGVHELGKKTFGIVNKDTNKRVKTLEKQVAGLKAELVKTNTVSIQNGKGIKNCEAALKSLDGKVGQGFDQTNKRFDSLDNKIGGLEMNLTGQLKSLGKQVAGIGGLQKRTSRLLVDYIEVQEDAKLSNKLKKGVQSVGNWLNKHYSDLGNFKNDSDI